jgi:hypothetical protein
MWRSPGDRAMRSASSIFEYWIIVAGGDTTGFAQRRLL